MATLLKYTAAVSMATGGVSLLTAFFQGADDYSSILWLGPGLAGYVAALPMHDDTKAAHARLLADIEKWRPLVKAAKIEPQ